MMARELSNSELDDFLCSQKYSQFLQSSSWAYFQKELGNRVWNIGIDENGLKVVALVVEKRMPFGLTYLYLARGPVISDKVDNKSKYLKLILKAIRDLTIHTKKKEEIFLRFEPIFNFKLENILKIKDVQPSNTLLLDLNKSEEQLLSEMHQKTRYNIRLAGKKSVKIHKVENYKEKFENFWSLISQTSNRDKFNPHPRDYYEKILKTKAGNAYLWIAEHNSEVLTANIIMSFGDTVTYVHGASSDKHRNLMAPHLLQWEQIKWAKNNGYKIYDFWGIAKDDNIKDKWAGLTRFKKGFKGDVKSLPGTFDLVYNHKMYKLYKIYKFFR